jgi:5-methylcytosine-specific restriction endonuclease McrA
MKVLDLFSGLGVASLAADIVWGKKERRKEYLKEYYRKNIEKIKVKKKERNIKNREKIRKYYKIWYEKNKEKRRIYFKEYCKKNIVKFREYDKKEYSENPEKFKIKNKIFRKKNPLKIRFYKSLRRTLKKSNTKNPVTKTELIELYKKITSSGKCPYCKKEMTNSKWTLDHIISLKKGGGHEKGNLTFCCYSCNSSKKDKTLEEFLKSRL